MFSRIYHFLLNHPDLRIRVTLWTLLVTLVAALIPAAVSLLIWWRPSSPSEPPPPRPAAHAPVLPAGANLVVFDACRDPGAVLEFVQLMQKHCPQVTIDLKPFDGRWEMRRTRIYPRHAPLHAEASRLEKWMPGDQQIVPYDQQATTHLDDVPPGRPLGDRAQMEFGPERDLGIFLGNDYPGILQKLRGS